MNEREWLQATDTRRMVALLWAEGKLFYRKGHLFEVACCRSIWRLMTDERSRWAVEVAERHAEGLASVEELTAAYYEANVALLATDPLDECYYDAAGSACQVAYASASVGYA